MTNKRKTLNAQQRADRDRQALELRIAGADYDSIAQKLGYSSRGHAYDAVNALLLARAAEPREELRALELDRLDKLLLGIWQQAKGGNLGALDRAVKLMERRARLLGLDAPARTEISGPDSGPVEFSYGGVLADLAGGSDGNP